MGVEVHNAQGARRRLTVPPCGHAEKAGKGDFVPSPEPDREVAGLQEGADVIAEGGLGRCQVAVAAHLAGIQETRVVVSMPREWGAGLADGFRSRGGTRSPAIAAHPFIGGKADQGRSPAGGGRLGQIDTADDLVPASFGAAVLRIGPSRP